MARASGCEPEGWAYGRMIATFARAPYCARPVTIQHAVAMKAITVEPGAPRSAALEETPEPDPHDGAVLVEALAVGVCGTDVEIVEGKYGWAPAGKTRLVLGHESLGRVLDPGPSRGLREGDLV